MLTAAGTNTWRDRIAGIAAPVPATFLASLLLSLLAVHGTEINRDGMLYVDTARIFQEQGFRAAVDSFSWPFLSILMAVTSRATGLGLEAAGYLLNSLFMAGACALLVACGRRLFPAAAWMIGLVILAVPGFNDYRDEVLREYGSWFFILLAFWLALRWAEAPRWPQALLVQATLLMAALFRPEALAMFAALVLWQMFAAPARERWQRLLMLGALPLLGLAVLLALYASGELAASRLAAELARFRLSGFDAKAAALSAALIKYAQNQAPTILFLGSLGLVPLKFVTKMGVFLVPLLYAFAGQSLRATLARCPLFVWAFLVHWLVLCVFALDLQFLAGRYAAPLILFAAPLAGHGLWRLTGRFPRWRLPIVLCAVALMAGNAITFAPAKLHYVEAGNWLAANATDTPRVFIDSKRTAYYAGWHYARQNATAADRDQLRAAVARGQYDLLVLEVSRKEPDIAPWLTSAGLVEIRRFGHPNGDAVSIAAPLAGRTAD
jgi:hypothetical protein